MRNEQIEDYAAYLIEQMEQGEEIETQVLKEHGITSISMKNVVEVCFAHDLEDVLQKYIDGKSDKYDLCHDVITAFDSQLFDENQERLQNNNDQALYEDWL